MQPVASARQALRDALDKPVGAPPLSIAARGKSNCLIVVTDHTRQNAYKLWLPELLDQLNKVGLPDSAISIFVASAMRDAMGHDDKLAYFGEEVLRRVKLHDHDARSSTLYKRDRTDSALCGSQRDCLQGQMLILTGGTAITTSRAIPAG